jgi:pyruvate dehydrogenase E2 component (dihydrolipoamide acetyltransferase)
MAKLLHMPEVSANATHAAIQSWTLKEGDPIGVGDCIAEIETEKALVELAAEEDAVLGKILVEPGREVEVGAPIGVLFAKGETNVDIAALLAKAGLQSAANEPVVESRQAIQTITPTNPAPTSSHSARIFASPLARRLAAAKGVDLSRLTGSGPNGRIVKRDIEASVVQRSEPDQPVTSVANHGYDEVVHSSMRKTIARRLVESKATVPHFYLEVECRMERLLALRQQVNLVATNKVSINDFIVKAAAVALRQVPDMNVTWTDSALRRYHSADVCVAVSTDTGLITPVVRNADAKPLSQISADVAELARRARDGRLRPEEYQGGSFTISNLGMLGVEKFSAIINPPHAAILAVGATQQKPVVEEGELKIGSVLTCTLSVDHRAVDGALAAKWLAVFKGLMENPLGMLI